MALEEGGRAVGGFIDALKSQPLSLALVVMNLSLIAYLYYQGVVATQERHKELELLYENRREVAELLFKCYPAPPSNKGGLGGAIESPIDTASIEN